MKIYTKKGDKGETSLIGGTRLPKDDTRIEAYGTVDELNSWIGLITISVKDKTTQNFLLSIQDKLFVIGSLLAADPNRSKMKLPTLSANDIKQLETAIDKMETKLPSMKNFVLPVGHTLVSYCHIARCVCRRAERICVQLKRKEKMSDQVIPYLNRLSDYLFVLSRKCGKDLKIKEIPWVPKF
jgi:cob(I)alamin adenosyltransferase